uniref:Uncharacterized protein n=1 Tax=Picea glauca TaxID=3330 RepID=A0A101LWK3_PICGL|nr:hypothetical protein ABT39_MTgene1331 [Picea glauca]QHR89514.1 hypothetical protein Q903MT_gene3536 [Picea sitchensis]
MGLVCDLTMGIVLWEVLYWEWVLSMGLVQCESCMLRSMVRSLLWTG